MLNGQLSDAGYATHLTQVASYFDIVDAAVKTGDTNKRYTLSTNVSTAPSPPISETSFTHIHIAPNCDNMCDLYNSYIIATMKIKLKFNQIGTPVSYNKTNADNPPCVWVGFKDSLHAISQYQLIANGNSIYNQTHAIEEAYITSLATPDTVINRDVFSKCSMKGIHERPECLMTGALVDLTNGNEQEITINLKIDLRRFLPLSAIKYLPAFVGNLELRVHFSTDGMVACPMPYTDLLENPAKSGFVSSLPKYTTCFVPWNEQMTAIANATVDANGKYTVNVGKIQLEKTSMSVTTCYSMLCCFGIANSIYQSLVQRYSGQSLSFPTQTLSFHQMDGKFEGTSFNLALTITPRFIDTIFFLFPLKSNYRTCYYNPLMDTVRLYMGGYGTMPDQSMSSYGMVAYEMTQNALNMNNDVTGLNEGVMRSQIVASTINMSDQMLGYSANDISNYILAFPSSVDNTFQQGQTSSSPITYELKGTLNTHTMFKGGNDSQCTVMMGFLKDSVLAIQIRPTGPPIIALDEFDIASPAGVQ